MKQLSVILALVLSYSFSFGQTKATPAKTYPVSLTESEWQKVLVTLDSTSRLLLKSDLPTREVIGVNPVISMFEQVVQMQVGGAIQKEQEAAKKDSTKPVKH